MNPSIIFRKGLWHEINNKNISVHFSNILLSTMVTLFQLYSIKFNLPLSKNKIVVSLLYNTKISTARGASKPAINQFGEIIPFGKIHRIIYNIKDFFTYTFTSIVWFPVLNGIKLSAGFFCTFSELN